jgi:N-acetyltransferase 10
MAGDLVPRFNERFLLSLSTCPNCLVCDDELNILPLSKKALRQLSSDTSQNYRSGGANGEILTTLEDPDLRDLKESLRDTPHVGKVVELAKTMDQAKAVLVFLEACASRESKMTVAMTAGRGRGKSAAMGLCLAGALSLGYSTVAVTAPAPENLVAVFDFVVRGLEALAYKQHLDFTITYNTASGRDMTKCIIGIELHSSTNNNNNHGHRQSIRYIPPTKPDQFVTCELLAIDEAAAIPLPVVQALMGGDRLTFLSSTINGYEGTGRALSLKLIKELRDSKGNTTAGAANDAADAIVGPRAKKGEVKVHEQRWAASAAAAATPGNSALREIDLSTPIRYAQGDPVEAWLNKLLCLDW